MIANQNKKHNKRFIHREFLNLFRAGRVGQGKEMSVKKFASPSEGAAEGGGVGGIPPRPSKNRGRTRRPARSEQSQAKYSFPF
jgi:hypothetical protein